jgi:hypothetical protein
MSDHQQQERLRIRIHVHVDPLASFTAGAQLRADVECALPAGMTMISAGYGTRKREHRLVEADHGRQVRPLPVIAPPVPIRLMG